MTVWKIKKGNDKAIFPSMTQIKMGKRNEKLEAIWKCQAVNWFYKISSVCCAKKNCFSYGMFPEMFWIKYLIGEMF